MGPNGDVYVADNFEADDGGAVSAAANAPIANMGARMESLFGSAPAEAKHSASRGPDRDVRPLRPRPRLFDEVKDLIEDVPIILLQGVPKKKAELMANLQRQDEKREEDMTEKELRSKRRRERPSFFTASCTVLASSQSWAPSLTRRRP